MTATIKINRTLRTLTMTANDANLPNLKAHLIRKGFDGVSYFGHAPAEGRKCEINGLFYRTAAGVFVSAL